MKATLIKKNEKQRYYQLDFAVKNCFGPARTIKEVFESDPIELGDEFELAEDVSESINKICVSDANNHIERLVFPAFYVRNKKTGEVFVSHRNNRIDGKLTLLIYGGNANDVYNDMVYVRHLYRANMEGK